MTSGDAVVWPAGSHQGRLVYEAHLQWTDGAARTVIAESVVVVVVECSPLQSLQASFPVDFRPARR